MRRSDAPTRSLRAARSAAAERALQAPKRRGDPPAERALEVGHDLLATLEAVAEHVQLALNVLQVGLEVAARGDHLRVLLLEVEQTRRQLLRMRRGTLDVAPRPQALVASGDHLRAGLLDAL